MLYLKSNEEKKLVFEIDIHGCNSDELQGYVRFEIYGAEYGFPAEVEDRKITAIIPPLKNIVEKDIEDGTVITARLDMITERHYFMPWSGEVKVGAPMAIKAKIKEEDSKSRPGVRTKLLTSGSTKPKVVESKRESTADSRVDRLERVVNKLVEGMLEKTSVPRKKSVPTRRKPTGRRKPITEYERLIKQPSKKKITKQAVDNLTEEQVYRIMERLGTTTPKVKRILYEQASSQSKSGKPADVLKEIIKIMGKKKLRKRGIGSR